MDDVTFIRGGGVRCRENGLVRVGKVKDVLFLGDLLKVRVKGGDDAVLVCIPVAVFGGR